MKKVMFFLISIFSLTNFLLAYENTHLLTLTAQNPYKQSFCFRENEFVKYTDNLTVTKNCPDIKFAQDKLFTAFTSDYSGRIEKLGNFNEIRQNYNISDDVTNEQIFDSIKFENKNSIILKDIITNQKHTLRKAIGIFQKSEFDSIKVSKGNVYIVRYSDDINFTFQRLVKFIVIDFEQNKSVTIEWKTLFDNQYLKK